MRAESFRARLALIGAAALSLRLLLALVLTPGTRGAGDWTFFHGTANLLADGRGFIDPFVWVVEGREVPTAGHPPLWPLLLSLVSRTGLTDPLAHRATGCVVGTLTVVLVGLLGRRVGGDRVGLVAAAIAAGYPALVAADGALMSEVLYGAFVATALLLAYRVRDRDDRRAALGLGAAIGLAALTRSEALALLALLAAPVCLVGMRSGRVRRLALVTAGCAVVLAPWTVRTTLALETPVLISTNDATVLAGANCDQTYRGEDIGLWTIDCISERSQPTEAEQTEVWRQEGLDYMADHAGRLAVVVPVRILRSWDLYQPRRMVLFAEGRHLRAAQAGLVGYVLLAPVALAGLVLLRRRGASLLILLAPAASVVLTSIVGYGNPRFRHAADLVLVVVAAVAVVALIDHRRARAQRSERALATR